MRLHGPLELAHLVRRQGVLEEDGGVVILACRRRQAPDLGGGRQAHAPRQWQRKVLTEKLTQAGMALSSSQEVESCRVKALWHRLLQQPEVFGSEHDEMWSLAYGNGLSPPGLQAGDERLLTPRCVVLTSGDPGMWGPGRRPLDTPVQPPDA